MTNIIFGGIIIDLFSSFFIVFLLLLYLGAYYTMNGWNVKIFVLSLLMFFTKWAMVLTVGQFTLP